MAGADLRPALSTFLSAFGLPVVVTRPAPDDDPIETEGIWLPPMPADVPSGLDLQRQEMRKAIAIPIAAVPTLPMKTRIVAAEVLGGEVKRWRVDGFLSQEYDHWRPFVIPDPEQ